MEKLTRFRGRSFGGSGSADGSSAGQKDLQPILAFTNHIDELKKKYIGRDGTGNLEPYIPEEELKRHWTKSRISEVSKAHEPYLTIKFEVVSKRCLQLFSILVYINKVRYFATFLEKKYSDVDLPFKQIPDDLLSPVYKDVVPDLLEHQWLFCPLVLDYALLTDVHLETSQILPFYDEEMIKDSGTTQIFKIRVHKSCNRLPVHSVGSSWLSLLSASRAPFCSVLRLISITGHERTRRRRNVRLEVIYWEPRSRTLPE